MQNNSTFPQRRSLRLKGYDYSQAGAYFVTICAHDKKCLFGEVMNGEMRINELGTILVAEWEKSAEIRSEVKLGPYVVMPNHFHGIIFIVGGNGGRAPNPPPGIDPFRRGDRRVARSNPVLASEAQFDRGPEGDPLPSGPQNPNHASPGDRPVAPTKGPKPRSIGAMVAGFKSAVTKRFNALRHLPGTPVWQRNYYEHVIRDEDDCTRIIEYITTNPQRWAEDSLHPDKITAISKTSKNSLS
jgi:REP element-mobilizing transposase RayT